AIPTSPAWQDTRAAASTAQGRQIAALAATGLTNQQIDQRLFPSRRTLGADLHRMYPKLGIASRAALRDAGRCRCRDGGGAGPAGGEGPGARPRRAVGYPPAGDGGRTVRHVTRQCLAVRWLPGGRPATRWPRTGPSTPRAPRPA